MTTAVVTGASSGIGLATVARLVTDHDTVWAGVRSPDSAHQLAELAQSLGPTRVRVARLDVDDDASVAEFFAEVLADGPVDALVNNAGVSGGGTIEEMPLAEFQRQMETNVFGLLRCTKAVMPQMRERRSGCIVNVGSLAGRFVRPAMGAYAATKHAVEALSEVLAQELAPFGVRVVVIEPGVVATPIWTKSAPLPTESAYPGAAEKALAYYSAMLADPTPAEVVAEVIAVAVADPAPKLRQPVGWDAHAVLAGRANTTDEEMVSMAALGIEDWKTAWEQRFGFRLG